MGRTWRATVLVAGLVAGGLVASPSDGAEEPVPATTQGASAPEGQPATTPRSTVTATRTATATAPAGNGLAASCLPEPHPCGAVWPEGLEGPFGLREVRRVQVTSHDGVVLDGWIGMPAVPDGVDVPVVLNSTPYLATCMVHPAFGPMCLRTPESPGWWNDVPIQGDQAMAAAGIAPLHWIQRGFALASFSLRGTGHSGGCFDTGGPAEQGDQEVLVDWLASQPWSNGRVGMAGLSYPGWTVWQAAVQAPAGLKAIVSVAPITDYYSYLFSPQGSWAVANLAVTSSWFPQYGNPSILDQTADPLLPVADRATCPPSSNPAVANALTYATGIRDRQFFEDRNLTPRLGQVTAAVLHTQGYSDISHWFQDRTIGAELPSTTPVREIRGWFSHEFPDGTGGTKPFVPPARTGERSWEQIVTTWLEYWLKGIGPVPPLGVDHLDQLGTWQESASWPPPEAEEVEVPLRDADLLLAPVIHETSEAALVLAPALGGGGSLCFSSGDGLPTISTITDQPGRRRMTIAGNPYLDLTITSSLPSGIINATLYDVGPGFSCPTVASPDARWLAGGSADLEHHSSRYKARPFPVGVPTRLRIDISDVTASIPTGHRLALVLTDGDPLHLADPSGLIGHVTVHGARSHLVLPILPS